MGISLHLEIGQTASGMRENGEIPIHVKEAVAQWSKLGSQLVDRHLVDF